MFFAVAEAALKANSGIPRQQMLGSTLDLLLVKAIKADAVGARLTIPTKLRALGIGLTTRPTFVLLIANPEFAFLYVITLITHQFLVQNCSWPPSDTVVHFKAARPVLLQTQPAFKTNVVVTFDATEEICFFAAANLAERTLEVRVFEDAQFFKLNQVTLRVFNC